MPVPESVLPPETEREAVFRPETQPGVSAMSEEEPVRKSKVWIWVAFVLAVVVLGALGYFVIYPIFSPNNAPVTELPPPPAEIIPVIPHQSSFLIPAGSKAEIRLSNLLVSSIASALSGVTINNPQNAGAVQEVVVLDDAGSQVSFSAYFAAFVPGLTTSQLANWFEDDFTAFLYYDRKGVWPGYAARIKNGTDIEVLKSYINAIEASDLTKFYITSPGTFGAFVNGQMNGKPTRYAVGSTPGSALNYGLIGNYLVVSTSYDGLKNAAILLGI